MDSICKERSQTFKRFFKAPNLITKSSAPCKKINEKNEPFIQKMTGRKKCFVCLLAKIFQKSNYGLEDRSRLVSMEAYTANVEM